MGHHNESELALSAAEGSLARGASKKINDFISYMVNKMGLSKHLMCCNKSTTKGIT
jgi:hypothetical protein